MLIQLCVRNRQANPTAYSKEYRSEMSLRRRVVAPKQIVTPVLLAAMTDTVHLSLGTPLLSKSMQKLVAVIVL